MKIAFLCKSCRAGMKGSVDSEETAEKLKKFWEEMHSGSAHIVSITKDFLNAFTKESGSKP